MPFTPFHFGLGVACKAVAPRQVSFQVFALSQILMDVEPGIRMALDHGEVHGWTHTWAGAFAVAVATVRLWKGLEGRRWYRWTVDRLTTTKAALSATLGTVSHVALDSLIHADMASVRAPFGGNLAPPWSHADAVWLCLAAALSGVALLILRFGYKSIGTSFREVIYNLCQPPKIGQRESEKSYSVLDLPKG